MIKYIEGDCSCQTPVNKGNDICNYCGGKHVTNNPLLKKEKVKKVKN